MSKTLFEKLEIRSPLMKGNCPPPALGFAQPRGNSRRQLFGNVRRAVVKIGNSVLAELPVSRIRSLAADVALLREGGIDVVIVSSGAIHMGMGRLDLKRRPRHVPLLQAASAVGQVFLMQTYEDAMRAHRLPVGQVLLTREDLKSGAQFLRARHTLMALLDYGAVPVILDDESIAVEEEVLDSETDLLAAELPRLVEADLLAMLTSAEGIYAASPRRGGAVIPVVDDIEALAHRVSEGISRGKVQRSLASKVRAAQVAALSGVATLVASGIRPGVLSNILGDDTIGTLLLPSRLRRSRKKWIAEDLTPQGQIQVSEETRRSLIEGHHSLQTTDVLQSKGHYRLGDAVQILDNSGNDFARGLVGCDAEVLAGLIGKTPAEVEQLIGKRYPDEIIRRDDLVIL
jgi:glutamate 5-kinase